MGDRSKVNLNASSELKNSTDDAIPTFMKSLGYKQSNILTDIRLAIGFSACSIAAITFYYDYIYDFHRTEQYTLYAVIAYMALNTLLTWWMWRVEGGTVYVGECNGIKCTQIVLGSHTEKYSVQYELKINTTIAGKFVTSEVKSLFSSWYNQQGFFHPKPFIAFLQNSISAISRMAPQTTGLKKTATAKKN
ncbi:signal peptidase complex subunit 2 [Trichophaea hybrida]|nr:signal peptidase complex subunit 2 [Trichophaea hybrida]